MKPFTASNAPLRASLFAATVVAAALAGCASEPALPLWTTSVLPANANELFAKAERGVHRWRGPVDEAIVKNPARLTRACTYHWVFHNRTGQATYATYSFIVHTRVDKGCTLIETNSVPGQCIPRAMGNSIQLDGVLATDNTSIVSRRVSNQMSGGRTLGLNMVTGGCDGEYIDVEPPARS
jgi:hypothetical protein